MKAWITSDHHFGHDAILEKTSRGQVFNDVEHMAEEFIRIHNERVAPDDEVYFLGDIAMGKREESLSYLHRMNGWKHLVPGNHDHMHPMAGDKKVKKNGPLYRKYFDQILEPEMWLSSQFGETNLVVAFLMCHFPTVGDSQEEDRYEEWRPVMHDGDFEIDIHIPVLHGHTHSVDNWNPQLGQFHVGIDSSMAEYGPICLDTIVETIYG